MAVRFEWDSNKAAANARKHGVGFDIAALAFADPFALIEEDRVEGGELRWRTLGMAQGVLLLLVAHTIRDEDDVEVIRIISARPATRPERRKYEDEAR